VTLLLSGFTAFDLMLYRHHSAETSTLLYDLTFGLLAMSGMPTVVALGSFAVAVYVHRVLPRYTAHLAFAGAAIHPLLLAAFVVRDGPLSLEGFSITVMPAFLFAWILGTALAMPREARSGRPGRSGRRTPAYAEHWTGRHPSRFRTFIDGWPNSACRNSKVVSDSSRSAVARTMNPSDTAD
jgi:hypothetical protein